jgi:hypothetical protein
MEVFLKKRKSSDKHLRKRYSAGKQGKVPEGIGFPCLKLIQNDFFTQ